MRPERLFLQDIVEAAGAIARFIDGYERAGFRADERTASAVVHKLSLIGEAAARLPASFRERHPAIPWSEIVGFRNVLVHACFGVDWDIVWDTAVVDVPRLRAQISALLGES